MTVKFSLIAAYCKGRKETHIKTEGLEITGVIEGNGIGKDGALPWQGRYGTDMKNFTKLTCKKDHDNHVIMGRKTWESLRKPLRGRIHHVLSKDLDRINGNYEKDLFYHSNFESCLKTIGKWFEPSNVMVIGGSEIYKIAIAHPDCEELLLTEIDEEFECDTFFPEIPEYYKRKSTETLEENCRFSVYKNCCAEIAERKAYLELRQMHGDREECQYLDLCMEILHNGNTRIGRNGEVKSIFGVSHTWDLRKGFPLLTTKKMFTRGILEELFFFLRGQTDSKILEEKKVNIWKGNTNREFLDSRGLQNYEEGDLGPMYGYQWFHLGADYKGCSTDYEGEGFNQMKQLLQLICEDPTSRRMLLTTYNPLDTPKSVLYPCHGLTVQFYVNDGELSCQMYQRSADVALGYPFNITSYAFLTHIIAKVCGLKAGLLKIVLGDAHIYQCHYEGVREQLKRSTYPFPQLEITKDFIDDKNNRPYLQQWEKTDKYDQMVEYMRSLKVSDFKIKDYKCGGRIQMSMVS